MENVQPAVETAVTPTTQATDNITLASNIIKYLNEKTGDKSVSEKLQNKIDEYTEALKIVYKLSQQVIGIAKNEKGEDDFITNASKDLVSKLSGLDQQV